MLVVDILTKLEKWMNLACCIGSWYVSLWHVNVAHHCVCDVAHTMLQCVMVALNSIAPTKED